MDYRPIKREDDELVFRLLSQAVDTPIRLKIQLAPREWERYWKIRAARDRVGGRHLHTNELEAIEEP